MDLHYKVVFARVFDGLTAYVLSSNTCDLCGSFQLLFVCMKLCEITLIKLFFLFRGWVLAMALCKLKNKRDVRLWLQDE